MCLQQPEAFCPVSSGMWKNALSFGGHLPLVFFFNDWIAM